MITIVCCICSIVFVLRVKLFPYVLMYIFLRFGQAASRVFRLVNPILHELFIGKVEAIHVEEEYLDSNGNILWDKMDLM